MAKKQKAAKAAKRGKAPARKVKAKAARVSKPAARRRVKSPVQQELIQGVRYRELDQLCRQIGDTRDEINRSKGEDADLGQKALKAMRTRGVTAYKASGIALVIVPGDEKLMVKKDRSNASDGGQKTVDTGTGQDAGEIGEALTHGDAQGEDLDTVN